MSELPEYTGWSRVPANLATASRLKELDLPRQPGEPAATVHAGDYRGKSDVFTLYDITASPPTSASAKQLEAAAGRRKFTACTDCGARPDTGLSQVTGRCETCLHIEQLRKAQHEGQSRRAATRSWAAERIADPKTLVAWIDEHTPPAPPSGRPRKPVAETLTAVNPQGELKLRISYRLPGVGPRTRAVPADALEFEVAETALRALGERYFVTWTDSNLWRLVRLATGRSLSYLAPHGAAINLSVLYWRGDIDPRTARHRPAIPPGNADRLALLLRRMAADTRPSEPTAQRRDAP